VIAEIYAGLDEVAGVEFTANSSPSFVCHLLLRQILVFHCPVMQLTPLRLRPSFSSPANSSHQSNSLTCLRFLNCYMRFSLLYLPNIISFLSFRLH